MSPGLPTTPLHAAFSLSCHCQQQLQSHVACGLVGSRQEAAGTAVMKGPVMERQRWDKTRGTQEMGPMHPEPRMGGTLRSHRKNSETQVALERATLSPSLGRGGLTCPPLSGPPPECLLGPPRYRGRVPRCCPQGQVQSRWTRAERGEGGRRGPCREGELRGRLRRPQPFAQGHSSEAARGETRLI